MQTAAMIMLDYCQLAFVQQPLSDQRRHSPVAHAHVKKGGRQNFVQAHADDRCELATWLDVARLNGC
jgi:hypothetical protein